MGVFETIKERIDELVNDGAKSAMFRVDDIRWLLIEIVHLENQIEQLQAENSEFEDWVDELKWDLMAASMGDDF